MKSSLKLKILRAYHSIRGRRMLKRFKHGRYYVSKNIPNHRYYYNKGHEFFVAYEAYVCPGVTYFDQKKTTFENWEISVLNFKEI